jgi:hypothetical protein
VVSTKPQPARRTPKDRSEIAEQLKLDPQKKIAVVFSHVLWDANLFFGEDLFEDYEDWFVQTVQAACKNPSVNWLIKLHPANLWKRARDNVSGELAEEVLIREKTGPLPDSVKLLYPSTDISTFSLFKMANYGITVRGTTGFELPCFGVRTLTAGTGRYSGLGFTNDSTSKEEYLSKLANILDIPAMTEEETLLARKHAYALFCLRPLEIKSFKTSFNYQKQGHHPLDHNLQLTVKSLEELEKAGDLTRWAKWAEEGKTVDYLGL